MKKKFLIKGVLSLVLTATLTPAVSWSQAAGTGNDGAANAGNAPASFQLIDERSPEDSKKKIYSYLITTCNYGVFRLGDEKQSIDRMERLRRAIGGSTDEKLSGKTIRVTQYVAHINIATQFRAAAGGAALGGGALAAAASASAKRPSPKCSREKMAAGWFEPSELTNDNAPVIIEISASVDGQPYKVRSVYSTEAKVDFEKQLGTAYDIANAKLIATLEGGKS